MAKITGGKKFQKALDQLAKKISKPGTLRVGFLENAKYPSGMPVAAVAAIQEYGAPKAHIPPRPFMRNTITKHENEWGKGIARVLKNTNYDVDLTLRLTGDLIKGQLQQSIRDTNTPALSQTTLMLRKMFGNHPELITGKDVGIARQRVKAGESTSGVSTKPLIWTGFLLSRVDYEVKT